MSGIFGKKKSSPAPSPTTVIQSVESTNKPVSLRPPNVATNWGRAQYGKNGYIFSGQNDKNLNRLFGRASNAFEGAVSNLQNPYAQLQQQQRIYRDAMVPAFDQAVEKNLGNAMAGLGNQYFSTFGNMTMGNQARDMARQRAELERQIYDAGQNQLNLLYDRASTAGNLAAAAQRMQMAPTLNLGNLLSQTGNLTSNYLSLTRARPGSLASALINPVLQYGPQWYQTITGTGGVQPGGVP